MSFWTGTSDEQLVDAEIKLVQLSGVDLETFKSYPVNFHFSKEDWKIDESERKEEVTGWTCLGDKKKTQEDNEYIWTYEMGDKSKTDLVIVHGYGGSGMIFFKMFKDFAENFHVYFIDLLGMGRSSRNDFECDTYQECENFFVNSIEKWRQKQGLEKMNLMGHSFGAFIASKYTLRYSNYVNKLILFSPWASEVSTEEHKIAFDQKLEEAPFTKRWLYGLAKWVYSAGTPFGVARKSGRWIGGFFIKKSLQKKFPNLTENERDALCDYMHQIIMRKGSSEYGFGKMFPDFMLSDKAIGNHLDEYHDLGIEISFYYGTRDWMDTDFNGKKISKQLVEREENVYIIDDAGHHIYF